MWKNPEIRAKLIKSMKGRIPHNKKHPDFWVCKQCGIKFKNKTGHVMKYCSRKCQALAYKGTTPWNKGLTGWSKGAKNGMWKGGVRRTYHQRARRLIEKSLNIKLTKNQVVHHIDGNWKNNTIENLKIMDRAEHTSYHRNNAVGSWLI